MNHAIRIHRTGGPEVLSWEPLELTAPGPGQVLLRHTAIGLNFIDVYFRTGLYKAPLPLIPGKEGVGVVEAVGPAVSGLAVGDRVGYATTLGSYCERRLIAARELVKLPDWLDDRAAAGVFLQGMTAQYLLRQIYRVGPGDTVLIHAAAGGVGLLACQWASALGATVIGTVSSDAKAELARAHGCAHPIVYSREDFVARVLEITDGRKLPVVYDAVGKETFLRSLDCLRPRGLMVVFGQASGKVPEFDINQLAQKGSLMLTRPILQHFTDTPETLQATADDLFEALRQGQVKAAVNQTYPLREVAQAQQDLEARRTTGSTVLTV